MKIFNFRNGAFLLILLFAEKATAASYTVTVPPGFSTIANHLSNGANIISELLPQVPEGSLIYKFEPKTGGWFINHFQQGQWSRPNQTLAPGEGAFIRNPGNEFTITFSGTQPATSQLPKLYRGLNLLSFPVPGETTLPQPKPGESIFRWTSQQAFLTSTFDDLDNKWIPCFDCPNIGPPGRIGESFYYSARNEPLPPTHPDVASSGTVYFNTQVPETIMPGTPGFPWMGVDARVTYSDGTPAGAGLTAQLFGETSGAALDSLRPLEPPTTFHTSPALAGYVKPVAVSIPGVSSANPVTLILRVFNSSSFETSTIRGQSDPITIKVGGGTLLAANLAGLKGFVLSDSIRPTLTAERTSDGLKLTYSGVLQSANAVAGPYSDVAGVSSPALIRFTDSTKFFRLKP